MDEIAAIVAAAPERISAVESPEELERLAQELIGRGSALANAQRGLGSLPEDDRPRVGAFLNTARQELSQLLDERRAALERESEDGLLATERVDVTLPGRVQPRGTRHLITETMDEITDIFVSLGYDVADGPEAELGYYNFDALNIPSGHPARADMDTIYLAFGDPRDEVLLRAHTSPVQVRYMEKHDPPVFIVVPGRVYRHDNDATHSPVFHQIEGLAVDDNITFSDLRGTLAHFVREFFGPGREVRFRPGYFPFTEPSAEMDVSWDDGWLELLGCGVVDPAVLEGVGYDPAILSGFAFGMGIERLAMVRHGISHVRHLYSGDVRVLEQFG
ncbi:MAG: phenylalanine--tRNA ligase subunit alpha [Acidimicrobiia bacterium]